ncbi:MAG: YdeI/OmpD-associated family protein [Pseudolysinimonas sp.]
MPTFTTELLLSGNIVGIEIPDAVVAELGGKRVPVVITLDGGYTYRNTTAVMNGRNLVGLSAEHRAASGYVGGETVEVTIERDDAPREVEVPEALAVALAADPVAAAAWEKLAYSHRKEHARAITEAKAEDTRARRVEKAIAMLRGDGR